MKKTRKTASKKTSRILPVGTQYEDYLTIKQKEQEVELIEQMTKPDNFSPFIEDQHSDVLPIPTFIGQQGGFTGQAAEEVAPPAGNVKAFIAKKVAPSPVKYPAKRSSPVFGDCDEEEPTYSSRGSTRRNGGMGGAVGGYPKYGATNYMEPVARTEMDEEGQVLPELEASEARLPSDIEQFDEIRNAIRIVRQSERTLVYCIVVDRNNEKNVVAGLRCYGGVAYGGYARDVSGDAYLVECVLAVHLGSIPFSFRLEMPRTGNWNVDIPIPEKVLESAFAPAQRKTLSDLRERFPEDRYEFQYLQMLMAN